MTVGRTLHVKCQTWEQVEQFYARKLRSGKLLSMKVGFDAIAGMPITLGLEMPNGVTIAIDGLVQKTSPLEGDTKTWIEVELVGFTDEVVNRIKALAGAASTPTPTAIPVSRAKTKQPVDELPADEREVFHELTAELKRLRQLSVHEVLGVDRDAEPEDLRRAWMALVRRFHPDLVVRRRSPAITHLAEELTILANRAYDRMREAVVSEGRGIAMGPVVRPPPGWLIGFEDLSSIDRPRPAPAKPPARSRSHVASIPPPINGTPTTATLGGETFETRARTMLRDGDADNAQEVLAAALVLYPRSKALRSLYYVASAMSALAKGEVVLAMSQLETALAHDDRCAEATRLLEHVREHGASDDDLLRSVFR